MEACHDCIYNVIFTVKKQNEMIARLGSEYFLKARLYFDRNTVQFQRRVFILSVILIAKIIVLFATFTTLAREHQPLAVWKVNEFPIEHVITSEWFQAVGATWLYHDP